MFYVQKKNFMLQEKLINKIQKEKIKNPDLIKKVGIKLLPKINKRLNKCYKKLILLDMLLETLYGVDSQIYINWHDNLNILSIDRDRK